MPEETNFWKQAAGRRYSRRGILRGAALGLSALSGSGLLACATKGSNPAQNASPQAAAGPPRPGGMFNTYTNVNLGVIDPQGGAANSASLALGAVYSRPFQYKAGPDQQLYLNHEIQGDWAASAESPDGLTWTFKLQPNAKFHNIPPVNGHAVESADVKASFERAFATPRNSYTSLYPMIDLARVIDAWPGLPPHVRAAVLAMVASAIEAKKATEPRRGHRP